MTSGNEFDLQPFLVNHVVVYCVPATVLSLALTSRYLNREAVKHYNWVDRLLVYYQEAIKVLPLEYVITAGSLLDFLYGVPRRGDIDVYSVFYAKYPNITRKEVEERSENYKKAGIDVTNFSQKASRWEYIRNFDMNIIMNMFKVEVCYGCCPEGVPTSDDDSLCGHTPLITRYRLRMHDPMAIITRTTRAKFTHSNSRVTKYSARGITVTFSKNPRILKREATAESHCSKFRKLHHDDTSQ